MDIFTERGKQTVRDEECAAQIWERHYPNYKYIITPKNRPAIVDAILLKDNQLQYCVETKCRYDMNLEKFAYERNYEWLVTSEKLTKAAQLSAMLGLELIGFLYLVPEKCLLAEKLTDSDGNFCVEIYHQETETQKTVNGGNIVRMNAFVNMRHAKVLY